MLYSFPAFLVWFLGVAFPFYGAINSLMGAVNPPITSFALPAIAYNLIYRHQGQRDRSIYPPPKWMQVRQQAEREYMWQHTHILY